MINLQSCGVSGDGTTDDAPAIQAALDTHRKIYIPYGHYRIGSTLRVHSGTRIEVHPHAELKLADNMASRHDDFLLTNADYRNGNEDIEISGGVWDGNEKTNRRDPDLFKPDGYSGILISFNNVRRLSFRNAILANADSFFFRASRVRHFLIEHLDFIALDPRPNNDGVHVGGGCEHGVIRHLRGLTPGTTNDDMVALNADDIFGRVECRDKVSAPIRHIHIAHLEAIRCHTFVRILSVDAPIEHITIDDVRGGCDVCAINMDAARACNGAIFDPNDPARAAGVGHIKDVRASRFYVHKTTHYDAALLRLETRGDLIVTDFQRNHQADVSPSAPTLQIGYLEDHEVEIEGLSAAQQEASIRSSSGHVETAAESPQNILCATLHRGEAVVVPDGGFMRLGIKQL